MKLWYLSKRTIIFLRHPQQLANKINKASTVNGRSSRPQKARPKRDDDAGATEDTAAALSHFAHRLKQYKSMGRPARGISKHKTDRRWCTRVSLPRFRVGGPFEQVVF